MNDHKCPVGRAMCDGPCYDEGGDSEKPAHCAEHYLLWGHHADGSPCHADSRCDRRRYPWLYAENGVAVVGTNVFSLHHGEDRAPDQVTERRQVERRVSICLYCRADIGGAGELHRVDCRIAEMLRAGSGRRERKDRRAKPADPRVESEGYGPEDPERGRRPPPAALAKINEAKP